MPPVAAACAAGLVCRIKKISFHILLHFSAPVNSFAVVGRAGKRFVAANLRAARLCACRSGNKDVTQKEHTMPVPNEKKKAMRRLRKGHRRRKNTRGINNSARTAYNRGVEKLLVSDAGEGSARIAYVYNCLSSALPASSPRPKLFVGQTRSALFAEEGLFGGETLLYLRDVLAETVAIGCKYGYFSARLPLENLTLRERKIFLCALIAADLPADKKYIRMRLGAGMPCALDGFFAFRLRELRRKWDKILSCVPPDFSREEMERFMRYVVDGNTGRTYLCGDKVYDGAYRLCRRGCLVGAEGDFAAEAEILFCCAAEVHVCSPVSDCAAGFLRRYYGAHTVFHDGEGERRGREKGKNFFRKTVDNPRRRCYNKDT